MYARTAPRSNALRETGKANFAQWVSTPTKHARMPTGRARHEKTVQKRSLEEIYSETSGLRFPRHEFVSAGQAAGLRPVLVVL